MADLNKAFVAGRLGRDPETLELEGKGPMLTMSVACHYGRSRPPTWVRVKCFGAVAEKVLNEVKPIKGDKIMVEGFIGNHTLTVGEKKSNANCLIATNCIMVLKSKNRADGQWEDEKPDGAGDDEFDEI